MGPWLACFVLGYCLLSTSVFAEPRAELAGVRALCSSAGADRAVAEARRAQGDAAVLSAEVLPNPILVAEHRRSLEGPRERETILGLSLPLGIGGRRWVLQDAARARRQQAALEAQAGLFESALWFREAYIAAVVAEARAEALAKNQAELDALTVKLEKLTRGGEAAGYDHLRQRTSSRLHRQKLELARTTAIAAKVALESWLEGGQTLPLDGLATLGTSRSELAARPSGDTAEVRGLEAQARADALEARAARRRAVPDLALFGGYRSVTIGGETGHGLAVAVELPITLFDHGQGEAARAASQAALARASARRLRRRQQSLLHASQVSLERLIAHVGEAQAITQEALIIRERASRLYAAGEADITELLEAHRVVEEAQLAELALVEQVALTRLAQMRAVGTMFDPELDRLCGEGAR